MWGKSYLVKALGYHAYLSDFSVRYYNTSKLLEDTQMFTIEAMIAKFFERMADVELLIIEDFGVKMLDRLVKTIHR